MVYKYDKRKVNTIWCYIGKQMIYEIIGLLGTIFVLISFLMRKERTIRTVNIIGAILFVVYGICIGAISTWLLNGILILIHIYFLLKDSKNDR